jgi:peptidyl-prolyl cis-trans isomerase D
MLEALRRGAGTWVAKIFIALLVMSFAVWGVADIFGGYGSQTLATVGDTEIGTEQYRIALQNQLRRLGQQSGRTLTIEEAKQINLDNQVLGRMISDAALQTHGGELNLNVTDKVISDEIVNEPAFRGPGGSFDRFYFEQLLRSNGLSERAYVAQQREANVREQLRRTLSEPVSLPRTLLSAFNVFENEKRTLDYVVIPKSKIGTIGEPTEAELKAYYDGRASAYTAPEYRKIGLLMLDPKALAETIQIGDDELKSYYEANESAYLEPERRTIQQISFPNETDAAAARQRLSEGLDFMALAKERGLSDQDVDLGKVTKSGLVDKSIADAAFTLEKEGVSAPISGTLTTAIVRVTEIEPEVKTPFEDAKPKIRETLAQERAVNDILDIHDRIEDDRAGGTTLSEVARKINASYEEVAAIDRTGRAPDGQPVKDLPAGAELITTAFESDVGIENDPIETEDQGFIWVDVVEVTPQRLKPLNEVRAQVITDWKAQETRDKLAELGESLAKRLGSGETLEKIAGELQLQAKQSQPLKRLKPGNEVPQAAVAQAFALKQGEVGSASAENGEARVLFKVVKVEAPPPLNSQQAEQLDQTIGTLLADDFFSQYLSGLRDAYGVTVNEVAFNEITGRNR